MHPSFCHLTHMVAAAAAGVASAVGRAGGLSHCTIARFMHDTSPPSHQLTSRRCDVTGRNHGRLHRHPSATGTRWRWRTRARSECC
uniref:Putative secreted protein n=1 Tax=Anopheles darlingi TaxID=43151 RepID=A0A2M4DFS6_ANODA